MGTGGCTGYRRSTTFDSDAGALGPSLAPSTPLERAQGEQAQGEREPRERHRDPSREERLVDEAHVVDPSRDDRPDEARLGLDRRRRSVWL